MHSDIISIILLQCPYYSETYIGFLFLHNKNSTTEQNFEERDGEKTENRQTKKSKKHDCIETKETLVDVQMQYENRKVTNNAYTQGHLQGFLTFLKTTLNET